MVLLPGYRRILLFNTSRVSPEIQPTECLLLCISCELIQPATEFGLTLWAELEMVADKRTNFIRDGACRQHVSIELQQRETFLTSEINRFRRIARKHEQLPNWTGHFIHAPSQLVLFFGFHKSAENVALGDDAYQLISFEDRQRTDLVLQHQTGCVNKGCGRSNGYRIFRH